MNKTVLVYISLGLTLSAGTCVAEPAYKSDYAGQEKRKIKSLSDDDISQLQQGKGWGLAKAAELNGMPGPAHVLQMKKEIALSVEQEKKVQALFEDMQARAIPLGKKLVELETGLNEAFSRRTITDQSLKQLLTAIADVQRELRYVHLSAHLTTPGILNAEQIEKYNRLRGYGNGDPCNNIPHGHDAAMWKKHNGCS